ncbi:Glutamate N-acetyltransferase / N-acetylglutamate synthase [Liberibacter crescens BT-1]|uniref:Arginine biosynthesis bifunctional protein ArgJ n=1 Tax=Liberibacter crescens (strain BT-1) TaxID=1215343 RepID=L0ES46_LIBCB|nr:bifunctional glutamate N-acetyltransferase/amino-acid acetyltransferase ArgJ [Liberibacter crescens]AGA64324.1 Glutamate N-acetyltransferase / N-acetylglutamate synthase [Liberibacter crescens BT-1]AMC12533.1 N-acetylglutamate synthase [Liberibacter crescens]
MSINFSPLAPSIYPVLPPIAGMSFYTAALGIKYLNRDDLLVIVFDKPASVAGIFTKSQCPSAPVDFCRRNLSYGFAKVVVINSGNANAFTGKKGSEAAMFIAKSAASAFGCKESEVYLASTGVIGEPLDISKFSGVFDKMLCNPSQDSWLMAAKAIMTTDTYPKVATRTVEIDGVKFVINGIAKGSGMIAPDMATMLSFVFTDIDIASSVLQSLLSIGVESSFNSITVDSDMSTSDTLMIFSTGTKTRSSVRIEHMNDHRLTHVREILFDLLKDLALQIVRDGEGATKMLEIIVRGGRSSSSAKKIAFSIANSPLVKSAITGEDANWGRVVMAVGKSGERVDRDRLSIWFGNVRVAVNGERDPDYSEDKVASIMKQKDIPIQVDLGIGDGYATVWTCNFTQEYVKINSHYRS